jgi:hypothetical protein
MPFRFGLADPSAQLGLLRADPDDKCTGCGDEPCSRLDGLGPVTTLS